MELCSDLATGTCSRRFRKLMRIRLSWQSFEHGRRGAFSSKIRCARCAAAAGARGARTYWRRDECVGVGVGSFSGSASSTFWGTLSRILCGASASPKAPAGAHAALRGSGFGPRVVECVSADPRFPGGLCGRAERVGSGPGKV